MKWLIYSLLLINLAFGLWHYRSQSVQFVEEDSSEENLRLVLLDEYLTQQEQVTETDTGVGADNVARCYTLGPFKSKTDAANLRKELETLGISATRRLSKDNTRQGYWLRIPPAQ